MMLHAVQSHAKSTGRIIARVFGLSLPLEAVKSLQYLTGRGLHEPLKIAINRSRWIAFARSLIHIIPVGFALFEIILNWNSFYVGVDKYNQASYQLVAKIHELMIQASLGAILFSYIRHEIVIGEGLPFGALFSGLQLNQISYLWSLEYWGSIRSHHLTIWRKIRLSIVIALCIILGTVCGPSSAVLLIPRSQYWPAGSTHIWLNTTRENLWPEKVDASMVPEMCQGALRSSSPSGNECPWSEWTSIREVLTILRDGIPEPYLSTWRVVYLPGYVDVSGKSAIREFYSGQSSTWMAENEIISFTSTQQAAVADALVSAASLWCLGLTNVTAQSGHGNPLSDQSDSAHTIENDYMQPSVDSLCKPDVIDGMDDDRPLIFPLLLSQNNVSYSDTTMDNSFHRNASARSIPSITKPGMPRSEVLNTPGSMSEFRLRWIDLSEDRFQGSSIGAAILLPRSIEDHSQLILTCHIAAGWSNSSIWTTRSMGSPSSGRVSSMIEENEKAPRPTNIDSKHTYVPTKQQDEFLDGGDGTRVDTNITESWADLLNPRLLDTNSTVIHELMQLQVFQGYAHFASYILGALVTNGLARTGFSSQLQGDLKTVSMSDGSTQIDGNYWLSGKGDVFQVNSSEAKNWTKLQMTSTLQGNAYNTAGSPAKIAICIIVIYCVVAFSHMFYAGIFGISSTAWDSIAEVVALAINSASTACLRNTKDDEGDGEHLELVFGDVAIGTTEKSLIQPNRAYGTMASTRAKRL
ncbi:hypothetical protein G7Y79_00046g082570 [Physcia stellaris]|nr:hypothetical protein G7Y79_00046g082570 [Physcia stellaris]